MEELKPCKCKSTDLEVEHYNGFSFVICNECDREGPHVITTKGPESSKEAAKAWNNRV